MEFSCFTRWDELPDRADVLFAQGEQQSVFFSRAWFENLVETAFDVDQAMTLACVVERDRLLAVLPLMTRADGSWQALVHRYSSLYSLLLDRDAVPEVLDCLAEGLSRMPLDSLRLQPFDEQDANLDSLQQGLQIHGFSCHRGFRFFNWFHRTDGQSFAEYWAARPAQLRNTVARKQRRLEREHDCEIRLLAGNDARQAMANYYRVYKASWKADELFAGIIDGLVARAVELGWLRLGVLDVKDQPVAAQLWFVVRGKASIFRLAYDQAWKQYSPGSILTRHLMEFVIDRDNVDEIDFLTGNEGYKQDWMSDRRARWGLSCTRLRTPKARLRGIARSLSGWMRGRGAGT
jgi:hypothetical protein